MSPQSISFFNRRDFPGKRPVPSGRASCSKQRHLLIIWIVDPIYVACHRQGFGTLIEWFLGMVIHNMPPAPDLQTRRLMRHIHAVGPAMAAKIPRTFSRADVRAASVMLLRISSAYHLGKARVAMRNASSLSACVSAFAAPSILARQHDGQHPMGDVRVGLVRGMSA